MKTDFLGGFYTLRSKILAAQSCINLYLELNESGSGEDGALMGTPGLLLKLALVDAAEVRGLRVVAGFLFAVCGSSVYRITTGWAATKIGTLPNSSGPISITDNGRQVLFSHQNGWHYVALQGSGLLHPTANVDQPLGAIVTEQDDYVLFVDVSDRFAITSIDDVTQVDPLDFASPTVAPDELVSIIADHDQIWLLSQFTAEVWSDTGNALFPFELEPGGLIEVGCAAAYSVVAADETVFWLAQTRNGGYSVVRLNGYKPMRVSTQAFEHALEKYSTVSDCRAFAYIQEGHTFIVFNFPTADETWVYDCATKIMTKRAWMDENGLLHRHRANCYAFFNGEHIVGDFENGKIYALDLDTYTDDGDVIYRERAWSLPDAENMRVRVNRVEVVAETGVGDAAFIVTTPLLTESGGVLLSEDGQPLLAETSISVGTTPFVWLQVSHDGGKKWGYERYQSLGAIGRTLVRLVWRRSGIGRQTVLRVATTCTSKVAWLGANVDADVLS